MSWCPTGRAHPDDLRDMFGYFSRIKSGGSPKPGLEKRCLTRSGELRWCSLTTSVLRRADDEVKYYIAVIEDISERKRIEDRQRLLIGELNHRIQNLFAVVQSVALHSLGGNHPLGEAREMFIDRLQSLGRAYTMMTEQEWRGAPLRQILVAETSAFADRVSLTGLDVMVRQKAAQSALLTRAELTTNAVKYGALSVPAS